MITTCRSKIRTLSDYRAYSCSVFATRLRKYVTALEITDFGAPRMYINESGLEGIRVGYFVYYATTVRVTLTDDHCKLLKLPLGTEFTGPVQSRVKKAVDCIFEMPYSTTTPAPAEYELFVAQDVNFMLYKSWLEVEDAYGETHELNALDYFDRVHIIDNFFGGAINDGELDSDLYIHVETNDP